MKNIILGLAAVLVLIGGFFFFRAHTATAPTLESSLAETASSSAPALPDNTALHAAVPPKLPASPALSAEDKAVRAKLQNVWNEYVAAAKAHDLDTLKTLSFQLSPICTQATTRSECMTVLDNFVKAVAEVKASDFTLVWYDERQAILLTEPRPALDAGNPGYYQPRIVFGVPAGKGAGDYALITVLPEWGRFANAKTVAPEKVAAILAKGMLDSDKDGLTDLEETCTNGDGKPVEDCTPTDPHKRDTNGDSWWDGIEDYFISRQAQ